MWLLLNASKRFDRSLIFPLLLHPLMSLARALSLTASFPLLKMTSSRLPSALSTESICRISGTICSFNAVLRLSDRSHWNKARLLLVLPIFLNWRRLLSIYKYPSQAQQQHRCRYTWSASSTNYHRTADNGEQATTIYSSGTNSLSPASISESLRQG